MDLTDKLVADFVKAAAPKVERKPEEYTIGGVVQSVNNDGTVMVLFDGATTATQCQKAVTVSVGDKVLVMVRDRQGTATSNVTKNAINADYLEVKDAVFRGYIRNYETAGYETGVYCNIGNRMTNDATIVVRTLDYGYYAYVDPDGFTVGQVPGSNQYTAYLYGGPYTPSDKRLKANIKDIDYPEKLLDLRPVSFNYIDDQERKEQYGFIAQEVQNVYPEFVSQKDGYLGLTYTKFITPAIAMIQKLDKRVKALESEIEQLKGEINELKHNSESSD